jgi:polysaccharide pyruvyl transferase WcaK-like protein
MKTASGDADILLYGYYGYGNLGDDLLLQAAISGIRRHYPNARFRLRNLGPISGIENDRGITLTNIERIAESDAPKPLRLARYLAAVWRALDGCRWLAFGGGTVFHERPSKPSLGRSIPVSLFLIACWCGLARLRNVRIVAMGVGVDEIRSLAGRALLRFILATASDFAVRDAASLAECRQINARAPLRLTADLAYGLADELRGATADRKAGGPPTVAITVAPHDAQEVLAGLRQAIGGLIDRGWRVVLLPFQISPDGTAPGGEAPDDAAWLQKLFDSLSPAQRGAVELRAIAADAASIAAAFRGLDVLCGMRYHGHVIASMIGLPFVGLADDRKIAEICRVFGQPMLSLKGATGDALVQAVLAAEGHAPAAALVDACARAASRNFDAFAEPGR